jgi:hypothetical protein
LLIHFVKTVRYRAVDIEDTEQIAILHERYDNFRS